MNYRGRILQLSRQLSAASTARSPTSHRYSSSSATTTTMSTMKAVVMKGQKGEASVVNDRPLPKLRPGYVLVKVAAVALNPTDWKHIAGLNFPNLLCGCDFAGTVEKTGTGYSKDWKVGDRICGFAHGGNKTQPEDGAFAEYIVARADAQIRIPDKMSFESAATLGVGIITVGQGLFQTMKLDMPSTTSPSPEKKENKFLLIYGGSTATGALGIQFAKLAGYTVVTTSSPRNFAYVESLGATKAFDYNAADCGAQIRSYTDNTLQYAWDCIAGKESAQICADALSSSGTELQYGTLLQIKSPRPEVHSWHTLAYTAAGEGFEKGKWVDAKPDDLAFQARWVGVVESLLEAGKVNVHRPKEMPGGLDGVLGGLDMLKTGEISGEKLVFSL